MMKSKKIEALLAQLNFYYNGNSISHLDIGRFHIIRIYTSPGNVFDTIKVDGIPVYDGKSFCFDGAEKLEPFIIEAFTNKIKEQDYRLKQQLDKTKAKQQELVASFLNDHCSN